MPLSRDQKHATNCVFVVEELPLEGQRHFVL